MPISQNRLPVKQSDLSVAFHISLLSDADLVQTRGMIGIVINLGIEGGHDPQFSIVGTDVDVEVAHIVRRALPPVFRMAGDVVGVLDDGRLAILRTH